MKAQGKGEENSSWVFSHERSSNTVLEDYLILIHFSYIRLILVQSKHLVLLNLHSCGGELGLLLSVRNDHHLGSALSLQ
jgi:hypothetical protein